MSELISKGALYKKIAEMEDLARKRVLDTPTNSPCYMRYVAQLNERTAFKHMIADEPTIEALPIPDGGIGELSDGYHTFNELYHHRAVLFSVICNLFPDKAWKSKLHDTGDMFDGMFIVGIDTAEGQATYHYDIDPYWEMFKVQELPRAPKWDGHTPEEAIRRIGTIEADPVVHGRWILDEYGNPHCSVCEHVQDAPTNYCSECGADMRGDQNE